MGPSGYDWKRIAALETRCAHLEARCAAMEAALEALAPSNLIADHFLLKVDEL